MFSKLLVFKGLTKTSLLDYPGLVSSIVFLGKCNMRCPFCHNPGLINNSEVYPDISEKEVIDFLKSRKKWIDALVITGGEPTIYDSLPSFIKKVKKLKFKVKLDTNGANPGLVKKLIDKKLLDYIAMDVKASKKNYNKASGIKVNLKRIDESIKLIKDSGIKYEFRTTIVPGIHSKDDLLRIGKWLSGAEKFVLQQFRSEFPTLDPSYKDKPTYSLDELNEFKNLLNDYFRKVIVKG